VAEVRQTRRTAPNKVAEVRQTSRTAPNNATKLPKMQGSKPASTSKPIKPTNKIPSQLKPYDLGAAAKNGDGGYLIVVFPCYFCSSLCASHPPQLRQALGRKLHVVLDIIPDEEASPQASTPPPITESLLQAAEYQGIDLNAHDVAFVSDDTCVASPPPGFFAARLKREYELAPSTRLERNSRPVFSHNDGGWFCFIRVQPKVDLSAWVEVCPQNVPFGGYFITSGGANLNAAAGHGVPVCLMRCLLSFSVAASSRTCLFLSFFLSFAP
jgi:hypothetical protein